MKNKEILIIFILTVLAVGLSCFYSGKGDVIMASSKVCGWPLSFVNYWIYGGELIHFFWWEFFVDFLFWFLVLFGAWKVIKCIIKRKLNKEKKT